jgi:NTE family protein
VGEGPKLGAHVGLIQALNERNIEIDALGATSAGALIGACYFLSQTQEELVEKVHQLTEVYYRVTKARNITWPLLSLFDPEPVQSVLKQVFQQRNIEDFWRPFFCVTTNLSKGGEGIHHRGDLVSRLYASNAPPGLLPPLLIQGQLHYDGGLLNNLPVDVMRDMLGSDARIIASSLYQNQVDDNSWHFPDKMTLWRYIMAKVGKDKTHRYPNLLDSFFQALTIGSSLKERQNSKDANVLIQPNTHGYSIYSARSAQENILMDTGFREGLHALGIEEMFHHERH